MNRKFKKTLLGGTFDHFHKGHEEFIKFALSLSKELVIGLTSDEYTKIFKGEYLENYDKRKKTLEEFIKGEDAVDRVNILKINDVYGPSISAEHEFDALIIVEKTKKGAVTLNLKRRELGFLPLDVIVSPSIKAEDGEIISSSRIRAGKIDRAGKIFINPKWLDHGLIIPESIKKELRKPLGELIIGDALGDIKGVIITVGDVSSKRFNDKSMNQKISVVDFSIGREIKFSEISEIGFSGKEEIIKVNNPAGKITPGLFKAIDEALSKKGRVIIEVAGEEDLSVLPAILAAPLGLTVFYGQPKEGIVRVEVTEDLKEKVYRVLTEFAESS